MREEDFKEIHKTSKEIADTLKDLCENDDRMKRATKTKIISCITQLQVISGWAKDIWERLKERKCSCCEDKQEDPEGSKKEETEENASEDIGKSGEELIHEMMDLLKKMYENGAEEDPSRYAENLLSICQMLKATPEQVLKAFSGDDKAQEELLSLSEEVETEEDEDVEEDLPRTFYRSLYQIFEDEDDDDDEVWVIRW